jgi:hypothetical protein
MKRPNETDWKYILTILVVVGAMYTNNGWWLLVLIPVW